MDSNILILIAAVLGFGISALLGKVLIPILHKVSFGQTILEVGPKWHKKKQGTPVMGGLMFIIAIVVAMAVCLPLYYGEYIGTSYEIRESYLMMIKVIAGLLMALGFGLIGFFDDYIKVVKKRNLGLNVKQKLVLQFLVAIAYFVTIYIAGGTSTTMIPFVGEVDLGVFYWIIGVLILVGMSNAVNFTDGIDGLNGSVTFFVCIFFMLISSFVACMGASLLAAAAAGGCLGYLIWNSYPAKVFMGDVGSLFLGGLVCALAYAIDMPILLLPVGIVYIIEIISVILQVTYFKLTKGKRLFKMTPIHHHFELSGWKETKICVVFSLVTAIGGIVALLLVIFGL